MKLTKFYSKKITKKILKIGIASKEEIHQRMIDIASGKYKVKAGDPKIWFTSMSSLAQVLSDENRTLLNMIKNMEPSSISELASLSGRKQSNLSRTLKTMSSYGLVKMEPCQRALKPIVQADSFQIFAY